ncbi:MAG: hypothetical protein E1N59_1699 [Puniceicoccaceae bacterium 5H]|nr:MAG: hypothetical protein E1N59_1699 [Puniceicoccaceae bacterium 5H]
MSELEPEHASEQEPPAQEQGSGVTVWLVLLVMVMTLLPLVLWAGRYVWHWY